MQNANVIENGIAESKFCSLCASLQPKTRKVKSYTALLTNFLSFKRYKENKISYERYIPVGDHSTSTYTKYSEKLTFLAP